MHNWTIVDYIYIYDGTIDGLLTIVYDCMKKKQVPRFVYIEKDYIPNLIDQVLFIQSDVIKANKMIDAIRYKVSEMTLYYVYVVFLSGKIEKSNFIVRYLIYAFKYGKNINYMKSLDCIIDLHHYHRQVKGEAHLLSGFLRFKELSNHVLYAKIEPDNDVLHLLADHFEERLKNEIWMIHDAKRSKIALYNRKEYVIVDADNLDLSAFETTEDEYMKLWKQYFKNISIKERENKRCQMHFMPKKYWKNMLETES